MTTSESVEPGTSTPCQKPIVANRHAAGSVGEPGEQRRLAELALDEEREAEASPERVGCPVHRAEAREQRERPALGGFDEAGELLVDRLLGVVAAPVRQVRRTVQKGVLVESERAADVEDVELVRRGAEVHRQPRRDRRAREDDRLAGEQPLGEERRDLDRRDPQRWARPLVDPGDVVVVGGGEPVDVGPQPTGGEHRPHRGLGRVGEVTAVSRPEGGTELRFHSLEPGAAEREDLAEIPGRRAGQPFLGAGEQGLLEALRHPGEVVDLHGGAGPRRGRRAPHRRRSAVDPPRSHTPRLSVTMSSSAWASSTMSTSCSGRTAPSEARSAPRRCWFTTTMSAAVASARARSAKHSAPDGQRKAPGHSSAVTLNVAHSLWSGSVSSSARSPVAVVSAHSKIRRTSSARFPVAPSSPSSDPWTPARRDSFRRWRHR